MDRRNLIKLGLASPLICLINRSVWAGQGEKLNPLEELIRDLGTEGDVYTQKDAHRDINDFDRAYNRRFENLGPKIWAFPKTTLAVQTLILWTRKHHIEYSIRSGGHSYEGHCLSENLIIDLIDFDQVKLDSQNAIVDVGTGVTLGQLYHEIGVNGFTFSAGTCPSVGIGGHTLGGGIGMLSRQLGMACDQLIEVEFVDPQGNIHIANQNMNPDYLWLARGGGQGKIGCATRLRFKLAKQNAYYLYNFSMGLPLLEASNFLSLWQDRLQTDGLDDLSSVLYLSKDEQYDEVWIEGIGVAIEDKSLIKSFFSPLFDTLKKPPAIKIKRKNFLQMIDHYSDDGSRVYLKGKSDVVINDSIQPGLRPEAWLKLFGEMKTEIWMALEGLGGRFSQYSENHSCFPNRKNSLFIIQWSSVWENETQSEERLKRIRNFYHNTRSLFPWQQCYANYPDDDLNDTNKSYYGENRLRMNGIVQTLRNS